jgi:acyl-CoA synthetase (AMP-forming)/AMP-acid ligase II
MHIAPPVAVMLRSTPLLDQKSPEGKDIDLSSVRSMLSGGAPTPSEIIKAIYARTGKVLQIGYGATEAGSNAHSVAQDLTPLNQDSLDELGSVGAPMGNLEICIRASEGTLDELTLLKHKEIVEQGELKRLAGESAPINPGLPGEVCLRGPHVMLGYYSGLASNQGSALDTALTLNALTKDGYYRTGDEGLFDHRGRLWIIGRTKELIKVRGFQVAPAELDSLFAKHPGISDAAATGVLDDQGAEQVVMYIVPRDLKLLSDEARQQSLAATLTSFVSDKAAK